MSSISTLPVVTALSKLEGLNERSDLNELIDSEFKKHDLPTALRKQIKSWDKLIYATLRDHSGSMQLLQLGKLGQSLASKVMILKTRAAALSPTDSKLSSILNEFESNLKGASKSALKFMQPSQFMGLGSVFAHPFFLSKIGAHTTKQPICENKYQEQFAKLPDDELQQAFCKIELEDISEVAKVLTSTQAYLLISSPLNDEKMAERTAYLIVSLPHNIIEETLHALPREALKALNIILKRVALKDQTSGQKTESFETMFQSFRNGFVTEHNNMRDEIDQLNVLFRDLKASDITKDHFKMIDELRARVKKRKETIENLKLLICGLGRAVFSRLSSQELPNEYKTLLDRLGEDGDAAGAPYGYIHANAFKDVGVNDNDYASIMLPFWNLDDSYESLMKEKDISTILDLKAKKIFNKKLLLDFLGIDEREANKVQVTINNT